MSATLEGDEAGDQLPSVPALPLLASLSADAKALRPYWGAVSPRTFKRGRGAFRRPLPRASSSCASPPLRRKRPPSDSLGLGFREEGRGDRQSPRGRLYEARAPLRGSPLTPGRPGGPNLISRDFPYLLVLLLTAAVAVASPLLPFSTSHLMIPHTVNSISYAIFVSSRHIVVVLFVIPILSSSVRSIIMRFTLAPSVHLPIQASIHPCIRLSSSSVHSTFLSRCLRCPRSLCTLLRRRALSPSTASGTEVAEGQEAEDWNAEDSTSSFGGDSEDEDPAAARGRRCAEPIECPARADAGTVHVISPCADIRAPMT